MSAGVTAEVRSIERAWASEGHHEVWVQLRTERRDDDTFWTILTALEAPDGEEGIRTQLGCATPVGYATLVDSVPDPVRLAEWAEDLAHRLTEAGFTGTLGAARSVPRAPWLTDQPGGWASGHRWSPVACTMWSADYSPYTGLDDNPSRTGVWPQPDGLVDELCTASATWVAPGGPEIVVTRRAFGIGLSDPGDLAALLVSAAHADDTSITACSEPAALRGRQVVLRAGTAIHQVLGEVDHWRDRIDPLRDAITAHPASTDLAFVRMTATGITGWDQIDLRGPLFDLKATGLPLHRHLLATHTPDAHGIQVVRDTHLAKAGDLSRWQLTDLGDGRHLLEAPDLEPWYADDAPDPATVEQARADFGPMLLTREVVAANPPPWFGGG